MYYVSAQGVDERAINVSYYCYYADLQTEILCHSDPLTDPVSHRPTNRSCVTLIHKLILCHTDPQTDPVSH